MNLCLAKSTSLDSTFNSTRDVADCQDKRLFKNKHFISVLLTRIRCAPATPTVPALAPQEVMSVLMMWSARRLSMLTMNASRNERRHNLKIAFQKLIDLILKYLQMT
jgi:hypothetical protein